MKRTNHFMALMLLVVLSAAAFAQSSREAAEKRLTQAFRGKNVTVNIDMPATNKGVEIAGGRMDAEKNRKRLDTYGTAIRSGEKVAITGIRVEGNKVSFKLAGGGAPEIDIENILGPRPDGTTADIREARARTRVNSPDAQAVNGNSESTWRYRASQRRQDDSRREAEYQTERTEALTAARLAALRKGSRFTIKLSGGDVGSLTADEVINLLKGFVVL